MTEIEARPAWELVNIETGEMLPATAENAAVVLRAVRDMRARLTEIGDEATAFLVEESRRIGARTFHVEGGIVELKGGDGVDYDPQALAEGLRAAGLPEERVGEVVVQEVSYRVNRAKLRSVTGANPDYKAAASRAEIPTSKKVWASLRSR